MQPLARRSTRLYPLLGRLIPDIIQSLTMADVKRAHSPEANGHDGAIVKRQRVEDGALAQSSKAKPEVTWAHTDAVCCMLSIDRPQSRSKSAEILHLYKCMMHAGSCQDVRPYGSYHAPHRACRRGFHL